MRNHRYSLVALFDRWSYSYVEGLLEDGETFDPSNEPPSGYTLVVGETFEIIPGAHQVVEALKIMDEDLQTFDGYSVMRAYAVIDTSQCKTVLTDAKRIEGEPSWV